MALLANVWFSLLFLQVSNAPNSNSATIGDSMSLIRILEEMSWPARILALVLALMSIYSIAVMLERWLTFKAARSQSIQFAPKVADALRNRQIAEAIDLSEKHKRSHLAIVVNAGLQEFVAREGDGESVRAVLDAIRDAVARAKAIKAAELTKGLSGLATVGSTAPFVGLLGTVLGIISAFQGIRIAEGTNISAVAGGISEALVETSFGLAVAIPAVWAFNWFNNKLNGFMVEMDNSSTELVAYLRRHCRTKLKETSR